MLTQVGKYEIVERIGVGGFGTVYKGRDPFIKRSVAIKTCQSGDEEIKKRFFREAEFAGNLHHPNVTTIYDFGVTEDGTPYIVQEFLTGDDLDQMIKRAEPIPLKKKLRILMEICEGLGYAHASGILHRDIKPSNIRILDDGSVKIMDFGIAKSMVSQSTLTQTGITLGTASYLAPEQIRGETLDPRTDIFSLGVLSYEFLAGQKPFAGDHISTVLYKIMNETPARPSDHDPAIPRAVDNVILKALEKEREHRHTSCAELRDELRAVAESVPDAPPGPSLAQGLDLDTTLATPSGGFRSDIREAALRPPERGVTAPTVVASTPTKAPLQIPPRKASVTKSSAADVRLRSDESSARRIPVPAAEGGGALKIFLGAVVVLLAVGGTYLYLGAQRAKRDEAAGAPSVKPSSPAAAAPATASPDVAPASANPAPSEAQTPTPAPQAAPVKVAERATTGVAVLSSNKYARLTIDGKDQKGLPAEVRVKLKPGPHTAVFTAPGARPQAHDFTVEAGETYTHRELFEARGKLTVTVNPEAAGASIQLDGTPIGRAPFSQMVPAGPHVLEVSFPGFETFRKPIEVPEEDVLALPIRLTRKD